jgi:hypothetical protein
MSDEERKKRAAKVGATGSGDKRLVAVSLRKTFRLFPCTYTPLTYR